MPIQPTNSCSSCASFLGAVNTPTDHRCAAEHRHKIAEPNAAYPTIAWMRAPAGACGPAATMYEPRKQAQIIPITQHGAYQPGRDRS
jgi:hypothetical protein